MSALFDRINVLFSAVPNDLIAFVARIGVGVVFFRSGLLKLEGWDSGTTLTLFQEEYKLPLIPPEIAAYLATAAELTLPPLLFLGLFTRYAAAAMLGMTLVIQIFVYPNAFDTHATWAVCLLFLMKYGAGTLSADRVLRL